MQCWPIRGMPPSSSASRRSNDARGCHLQLRASMDRVGATDRARERAKERAERARGAGSLYAVRQLPIRWRVLSLAALNAIVVIVFAAVIWDGTQVLTTARNELRQTRDSDRLLTQLETDAVRLQGLIHRYFTQPNADLMNEITDLRETLMTTLKVHAPADPILARSTEPLLDATERFVA